MDFPVVARDAAHRYTVEGDARVFESVTTVTSATFSKEAIRASVRRHAIEYTIAEWPYVTEKYPTAQAQADFIEAGATRDSMRKADLGTEAHALFERIIKYLRLVNNTNSPDRHIIPEAGDLKRHAEQFLAFERTSGVRWLASEVPLVSRKYGFGGTLDALGMVPAYVARRFVGDPSLTLVDFKTGPRTWAEHVLQLAAYREMLREAGTKIESAGILHVPGGDRTWEWAPIALTARDFDAFLWSLDRYRWEKEREKTIAP